VLVLLALLHLGVKNITLGPRPSSLRASWTCSSRTSGSGRTPPSRKTWRWCSPGT